MFCFFHMAAEVCCFIHECIFLNAQLRLKEPHLFSMITKGVQCDFEFRSSRSRRKMLHVHVFVSCFEFIFFGCNIFVSMRAQWAARMQYNHGAKCIIFSRPLPQNCQSCQSNENLRRVTTMCFSAQLDAFPFQLSAFLLIFLIFSFRGFEPFGIGHEMVGLPTTL